LLDLAENALSVRGLNLTVIVPPDLGDRFFGIMRGLGDEGQNGAPSGDLVLVREPTEEGEHHE
jgi:hypothetical protein